MPATDVSEGCKLKKMCVVCQAPIHKLCTVCVDPACLATWQAWRKEASGRLLDVKPRVLKHNCRTCGKGMMPRESRGDLCSLCHRTAERAKKPAARPCKVCLTHFTPYRKNQAYCGAACKRAFYVALNAGRDRTAERARERAAKVARKPPRAGCASCEHGRVSKASETGYECRLQARLRCKPETQANLYVWWEVQDV